MGGRRKVAEGSKIHVKSFLTHNWSSGVGRGGAIESRMQQIEKLERMLLKVFIENFIINLMDKQEENFNRNMVKARFDAGLVGIGVRNGGSGSGPGRRSNRNYAKEFLLKNQCVKRIRWSQRFSR